MSENDNLQSAVFEILKRIQADIADMKPRLVRVEERLTNVDERLARVEDRLVRVDDIVVK